MAVPVGVASAGAVRMSSTTAWRLQGNLLFVAIAYGALAFGAAYPWAYWPLMLWCTALATWALVWRRGFRWRRPPPLITGLLLTGAGMAIQIIPLPYSLFVRVAPAADRFLRAYQVGYAFRPPAWHAASIDPWSTAQVLALFVTLAIFLCGMRRAVRHIDLASLAARIMVFGIVLSIFGAIQKSFDYRDHHAMVYGFWERSKLGNPFGPFVNRNHFAGWMVLALPLAIGYACAKLEAASHPRGRRWTRWLLWLARPEAGRFEFAVVCVLIMATALVLTGSRSGVASFALSLVAMAILTARRIGGRAGRLLGLALAGVFLVGAIAWGGVGATAARFAPALLSKDVPDRLGAWRDSLHIAHDFPIFGTGLGNFGPAMIVYQTGERSFMFEQSHNDYLQILAEGGLVTAVGAVWTVVALVRLIRRRFAEADPDPMGYWLRAGAIAGIIGMAAQEFVDFSLQLCGITVLFIVLLAMATRQRIVT